METLNFSKLLPIQSHHLNDDEINTINSRQLHSTLAIKKQFSNWIENQIQRAGLVKNVDYIVLNQQVKHKSGTKHITDYILTLDSAKHIAMMSQSKKAKDVRDYFIETEKNYISLLKKKALANTPTLSLTSSLTDELFKRNELKKLTPNEIRVLSTLIKLQDGAAKNYLVMSDAQIGFEASIPTKGVTNSFVNLDDIQGLVKRVNKRNNQGLMERRLYISEKFLAELNFETKNKNVAVPPPSPVVKEPIQTTPNIAELEKLIKNTIGEALKPLFAQSEKTYALPLNPKAKKIKALKHAIQIGKEMMVQSPHLKEEYKLQIHNGEVQLSHLLEA